MKEEITVLTYIRLGGLQHIAPYSTYGKEDYYRLAADDEIWETGSSTIFTVASTPWVDTYITFDKQGVYLYDTMEISLAVLSQSLTTIPQACVYRYSDRFSYLSDDEILEELVDADERVIFLKNGTDLHFLKSRVSEDDLLIKVIANSPYREATKKLFD